MDLTLRETLERAGVWESYKIKHRIIERAAMELFDYSEAAQHMLFQDLEMDSEYVIQEYRLMQGIDPNYSTDHDEEHFEEWLKDYVENRVTEVIGYLYHNFTTENGEIILYRAITAPPTWVAQGGLTSRGLGIFWSWDKDAANTHWGDYSGNHETYLLQGTASRDEVDWTTTIFANANPSYEEEKEVRLNDNATIIILGLYQLNNGSFEQVDIGDLAGESLPV